MARVVIALAVNVLVAAAADYSRSGQRTAESSLAQIRDTLRNLRRSIEDEGHDAETFYELRQKWCDETLTKFDESVETSHTSLVHLSTDLKEHEAAVEEAEGTAQQIRADIALVQHTLNQTEATFKVIPDGPQDAVKETHRLLTALVQNKKQTLTSLQGELQVVLPTLAEQQARLAETRQRFVDQNESSTNQIAFVAAVRSGCADSAQRADMKATARMSESSSIETALQALEQIAARERHDSAVPDASLAPAAVDAPTEVSFVQVGQEAATEDDLMSIFSGPPRESEAPTAAPEESRPALVQQPELPAPPKAPSAERGVQQLLSQLVGTQESDKGQSEWCATERAQNQLVLRLAKASAGEIQAEIDAHLDAEAQIGQELGRITSSVSAIQAAAKGSLDSDARERQRIAASAKDQGLATKILAQAVAILGDLSHSGRISGQSAKAAQSVESALNSAKATFESHAGALHTMLDDITASAKVTDKVSQESMRTLQHEQANLELVRDSHVSRRTRCVENKQVYEAQANEASEYSQTLTDECEPKLANLQNSERAMQIHALQDAQKVLEGKDLGRDASYQGLRGSPQKPAENMSPMERAAAEMGIAVDGN